MARWAFLDINGTVLDPATIDAALGRTDGLGLAALQEAVQHAMVDTITGRFQPLPEYLHAALARRVSEDDAVKGVRAASELRPFPDAHEGIERLRARGMNVAAVTNSATEAAERTLEAAGLRELLALVVGCDEVQVYKPHPRVYAHALERAGCAAGEAVMIAAHWWDLLGASRAGLGTAFVARHERELPSTVPRPAASGPDLVAVADGL